MTDADLPIPLVIILHLGYSVLPIKMTPFHGQIYAFAFDLSRWGTFCLLPVFPESAADIVSFWTLDF